MATGMRQYHNVSTMYEETSGPIILDKKASLTLNIF